MDKIVYMLWLGESPMRKRMVGLYVCSHRAFLDVPKGSWFQIDDVVINTEIAEYKKKGHIENAWTYKDGKWMDLVDNVLRCPSIDCKCKEWK